MRVPWSTFKEIATSKKINIQYIDLSGAYWLKAFDGPFEIEAIINQDDTENVDLIDFEANYKAKSNLPIELRTGIAKIPKVSIYKAEGSSATKVTHDFTNKTTWFTNSILVENETLVLESGKIYTATNDHWIDLNHGNYYAEDNLTVNDIPLFYGGVRIYQNYVYDNGTELVEDTDYIIDHHTGKVTFDADYTIVGTITATYHYATDATWVIKPDAGKILHIEHSELQFSKDFVMSTPMKFEIWVYHPDQVSYPSMKIKYKETIYKNIKDIINAANLGQGFIPACSGLTNDVLVFPFSYATLISFQSSVGAELRVTMDIEDELAGEWATATFYSLSEDEV